MAKVGEVQRGAGGRARAVVVKTQARWTIAKQRDFLATLAETANIARSARAVGMSEQGAYALRRRDEGFRRAWMEALSEGFDKLELMLLDRAMNGTPREHLLPTGAKKVVTEFSEALALKLLAQHRGTVQQARRDEARLAVARTDLSAVVTVDAEEVRADLIAKLELMGLRLGGGEQADEG